MFNHSRSSSGRKAGEHELIFFRFRRSSFKGPKAEPKKKARKETSRIRIFYVSISFSFLLLLRVMGRAWWLHDDICGWLPIEDAFDLLTLLNAIRFPKILNVFAFLIHNCFFEKFKFFITVKNQYLYFWLISRRYVIKNLAIQLRNTPKTNTGRK